MFILTSLSCYWSFLFSALECIFAHCACVCVYVCGKLSFGTFVV